MPASSKYPATDTELSPERQKQINEATSENPVAISQEEVKAMNLNHVKVGLGSGRLTIDETW